MDVSDCSTSADEHVDTPEWLRRERASTPTMDIEVTPQPEGHHQVLLPTRNVPTPQGQLVPSTRRPRHYTIKITLVGKLSRFRRRRRLELDLDNRTIVTCIPRARNLNWSSPVPATLRFQLQVPITSDQEHQAPSRVMEIRVGPRRQGQWESVHRLQRPSQ